MPCWQRQAEAATAPASLELATNEELVAELLRRETFAGVIIRQVESFKGPIRTQWRWDAKHCDQLAIIDAIRPQMESNP